MNIPNVEQRPDQELTDDDLDDFLESCRRVVSVQSIATDLSRNEH